MVLAPLADVTDAAFRRVIAKYSAHERADGTFGGPDVMWTEFVSADGLIRATPEGKQKLLADLIYTEAERPIPVSSQRAGRGVWGVATWTDVDPRIDFFSVFVGGLTNAYRWEDTPGAYRPGDFPGKGREFVRKMLQLNFWRPGDELLQSEREFRYGVPLGQAEEVEVGDLARAVDACSIRHARVEPGDIVRPEFMVRGRGRLYEALRSDAGDISPAAWDGLPDWSGVWQMVGGTVFDRAIPDDIEKGIKGQMITLYDRGAHIPLLWTHLIPATLEGRAMHNVQNAMFAAAVGSRITV